MLSWRWRGRRTAPARSAPRCPPLERDEQAPPEGSVGGLRDLGQVSHLAPDLVDVPAREPGQRLGLLLPAVYESPTVVTGRLAFASAQPRVPEHEAALEVRAVGGLLEDEVLGKVGGAVADVEAGQEHAHPAPPPPGPPGRRSLAPRVRRSAPAQGLQPLPRPRH